MIWPKFDPVVAINQAVSATYTLAGVLVGGYLAFRLALRNLRNARAIERRIQWRESLLDAVNAYARVLQSLPEHEIGDQAKNSPNAVPAEKRNLVDQIGPDLFRLLERATLYCDPDEQSDCKEFLDVAMDAFMATYASGGRVRGPRPVERIKAFLPQLSVFRERVVDRLRREMGLTVGKMIHRYDVGMPHRKQELSKKG